MNIRLRLFCASAIRCASRFESKEVDENCVIVTKMDGLYVMVSIKFSAPGSRAADHAPNLLIK